MARMPKAAAVPPSPKVMYFVCAYDCAIGHPRKSTRNRRVRRSNDTEHAHAIALLMQIKGRRTGGRLRRFFPSLMGSSTTLADLLTPLLDTNPFSTVRASFRWQLSNERDNGVADGRQAWLRRRSIDSFFPASLF